MINLVAPSDGAAFGALVVDGIGDCRGTVVILQEIFGIDDNLRADAQRWAVAGYDVIVPSLFDRIEPGFTSDHSQDGIAKGFAALGATPDEQAMADIAACMRWAKARSRGPTFLVGYCYGGRLAWRAAHALDGIAAAAVYYGNVVKHLDLEPKCPVICHFGAKDGHLPGDPFKAQIIAQFPAVPVHVYANSGHGFNNADASDADPADAVKARERTRAFFAAIA